MISLRKSGSIGLNGDTMAEYFEGAEAAVLYYDDEDDRVGIEPVDDADADGAYTISRVNDTGSITPSAFLSQYDLVPEITTQYEPELVETDDGTELVAFDVDEPTGTYGSPAEDDADDESGDGDDDADDNEAADET